jgi:pyrrolidone-carboxylate peptidase
VSEEFAELFRDCCDIYSIESSERAIEGCLNEVDFSKYDYVIGVGQYSGRDQDKIRIERSCSAQFRNKNRGAKRIKIPYFLSENECMKLSDGIGNSYCNLLSYNIVTKFPAIKYTFLHIPCNIKLINE